LPIIIKSLDRISLAIGTGVGYLDILLISKYTVFPQLSYMRESNMERTWKPTVAGILQIVAGVILALFSIALGSTIAYCGRHGEQYQLSQEFDFLFLVTGLLSLVSIIGGIHSLRRTNWEWSLAGAICSSFVLLGIPALILVTGSKKEFLKPGVKLSRIYIPALDEALRDKVVYTKLEAPRLPSKLRCRDCRFVDPTQLFSIPWCKAPKPPEINDNQCLTFVLKSDNASDK
jgi:hypothetical protein